MKFHAERTGHTRNAKEVLQHDGCFTKESVDAMSDAEVDDAISEKYVAVVLQAEAGDYDDVYLVPKGDWSGFQVIRR